MLLNHVLATRYGLSPPRQWTNCHIAVQVGNDLLDRAFRADPDGDPEMLD